MNKLLEQISKTKSSLTGKKWVKRAEIEEQKEADYLREQERLDKEQSEKLQRKLASKPWYIKDTSASVSNTHSNLDSEVPLTYDEIVFRLRKLKQPAKYFGESLLDQYNRLKATENKVLEDGSKVLPTIMSEIDSDISELEGDSTLYDDSSYIQEALEVEEYDEKGLIYRKRLVHPFQAEAEDFSYSQKTLLLSIWCRHMLQEWEKLLTNSSLNSSEQRELMIRFSEVKKVTRNLIRHFKEGKINEEILNLFYITSRLCKIRSYVKGHDFYLKLITGGISWNPQSDIPIPYRNIYLETISDESQRKFTQCFKRLISVCQKVYPTSHIKTVYA